MSTRYDKVRARLDAIGNQLSRGRLTPEARAELLAERHQLEDEFNLLAKAGLVPSPAMVEEFFAGEVRSNAP